MDWSQYLYIGILGAAITWGLPRPQLVAVMLFNLAGTLLFHGDTFDQALIDLVSATALLGRRRMENTVAVLFVAMAMWEVIAYRLQVSYAIISTGTDVLAYVQCGVVSGADRGMGRVLRAIRGRWIDRYRSGVVAGGDKTGFDVAGNSQTHIR